jgi:small subunit ribosomal protein S21
MAEITVRDGENLEKAIRRFNRKVDEEHILKEFRDRQYYVKPSKKRREKVKAARRKMAMKNVKNANDKNFDRK